ncbi:hypothetical protein H2248_002961 [Termitomyces sp. 'cryptogamus']|nr:hypothetical protein H2248_002961 [Termitomyces sp. 'cryptogamus']
MVSTVLEKSPAASPTFERSDSFMIQGGFGLLFCTLINYDRRHAIGHSIIIYALRFDLLTILFKVPATNFQQLSTTVTVIEGLIRLLSVFPLCLPVLRRLAEDTTFAKSMSDHVIHKTISIALVEVMKYSRAAHKKFESIQIYSLQCIVVS